MSADFSDLFSEASVRTDNGAATPAAVAEWLAESTSGVMDKRTREAVAKVPTDGHSDPDLQRFLVRVVGAADRAGRGRAAAIDEAENRWCAGHKGERDRRRKFRTHDLPRAIATVVAGRNEGRLTPFTVPPTKRKKGKKRKRGDESQRGGLLDAPATAGGVRPFNEYMLETARDIVARGEWDGLRFDMTAGRWLHDVGGGDPEAVTSHVVQARLWLILGDAVYQTQGEKAEQALWLPTPRRIDSVERALRALCSATPRPAPRPDMAELLGDVRAGRVASERPRVGELLGGDGLGLAYRGKLNTLSGEPSAGKSWIALAVALTEARRGNHVVWVDLEDSPTTLAARMAAIGFHPDEAALVDHVRPERGDVAAAALPLLHPSTSLVVVDSVGEALSAAGLNQNDDGEVAGWMQQTRRIADAGPAVLALDHVAKGDAGRGLWAIGSQRKLAAVNGVAFVARSVKAFARGKSGTTALTVAKDRGGVWSTNQRAADVALDATAGDALQVAIWAAREEKAAADGGWRPTSLMERASKYIEEHPGATANSIRDALGGNRKYVQRALQVLTAEGFVTTQAGARNAILHHSTRPFREADDAQNGGEK